jgi:oxaloacetate decarboxylase beta subunit
LPAVLVLIGASDADCQKDEDQNNFILMHTMGANTAGHLGSVIAGGILLAIVSKLI